MVTTPIRSDQTNKYLTSPLLFSWSILNPVISETVKNSPDNK